jgi:hypothetical protein
VCGRARARTYHLPTYPLHTHERTRACTPCVRVCVHAWLYLTSCFFIRLTIPLPNYPPLISIHRSYRFSPPLLPQERRRGGYEETSRRGEKAMLLRRDSLVTVQTSVRCARTHARTHACTHARTHACTHARTHACARARTHARAYSQTKRRVEGRERWEEGRGEERPQPVSL